MYKKNTYMHTQTHINHTHTKLLDLYVIVLEGTKTDSEEASASSTLAWIASRSSKFGCGRRIYFHQFWEGSSFHGRLSIYRTSEPSFSKLLVMLSSNESTADITEMMQKIPIVIPRDDRKLLRGFEESSCTACMMASYIVRSMYMVDVWTSKNSC